MTNWDIAVNLAAQGISAVLLVMLVINILIRLMQRIVVRFGCAGSISNVPSHIESTKPLTEKNLQIVIQAALDQHFSQR